MSARRFVVLERGPDRWCILDEWCDRVEVVRFWRNTYARGFVHASYWWPERDRPLVLDKLDELMADYARRLSRV